jgi:RHS repeat-associated protein
MNSGAVTLVYDGDGNRVAKTVGGVTTQYLVDDLNPTGLPQVVDELVNGVLQRTYTYGSQRISQYQNISGTWTSSFYGYDGGEHVRLLTDLTGTVTDTYDYDAFGNLVNSTGNTPNVYLYRGEQWDGDLGLYYLRARYYNPQNDRFVARDTKPGNRFLPGTLHKYVYTAADPINLRDPSGHGFIDRFILTGTVAAQITLPRAAILFGRTICPGLMKTDFVLKVLNTIGFNLTLPDFADQSKDQLIKWCEEYFPQ